MWTSILPFKLGENQAEANIVVAVVGAVVVAVCHTAVLRIVVPASAAVHPSAITLFQRTQMFFFADILFRHALQIPAMATCEPEIRFETIRYLLIYDNKKNILL